MRPAVCSLVVPTGRMDGLHPHGSEYSRAMKTHPLSFLAAGMLVAGCSASPTAPAGSAVPSAATAARAPDFQTVEARYTAGFIHVSTFARTPARVAPFAPDSEGGWCFQLFMDTDRRSTGYGTGYDYLVRAIEVTPGGAVHVRRTEGGGGPGGWGEAVGRVALDVTGGGIEFTVPFETVDDWDGLVDFTLEVYRTVRQPEKYGGGLTHEFVANYSGTSVAYDAPHAAFVRSLDPVATGASRSQ